MLLGFAIGTLLIFMQNATFSWFNTLFLKPNSMGLGLIVILNFFRFFKILWVLVAYMVYLKLKKRMSFKEMYQQNALYFNILIMLILIHSSITFLFYRQVIGIEIISAIIFFRLLPENKINKSVLVLFSIVAVIIMAYSIRNMLVSNAEFRKIESDYNKSSDGVVYHDIKFSFPIVSLNMDLDTYMLKSYNQILKSQGKKPLIQYPEALKGKDLKNPKNEVIKMKAGDYLVIENKHNPPKRWVSEWIRDYYFYQWPKTDYEFNPEDLPYVVIDNEDCVVAIVHQKLFYNPCVGVRFEE